MQGSWRTTVSGIVAILGAILLAVKSLLAGVQPDWAVVTTGIAVGIGLIAARDNKVTSEQAGAGK